MSESTAPKAAKPSPEEAKLEAQRFAAEQRALGRTRVAGWVPRAMARDAEALLGALLDGREDVLPAAVAARDAELARLRAAAAGETAEDPAAAAHLAQAQHALETARAEAAESAAALEAARTAAAHAARALDAARADAARARQEAAEATTALADSERHRTRAETHLGEALATLRQIQPLNDQLKQPGLRTALARRLLDRRPPA